MKDVEWSTGAVTVGLAYLFSGPFGCRCLTSQTLAPSPALPHQTGRDHFGHPAFRQHSPTTFGVAQSFRGDGTVPLS
jgi:hypothetical protein